MVYTKQQEIMCQGRVIGDLHNLKPQNKPITRMRYY